MKKYFLLIVSCSLLLVLLSLPKDAFSQNVGIGTPNPQNKLHVAGGFRLDTLTGVSGAGLVRHDANGVVYGIKFTGNANDVLRGDGSFGAFNVNGAVGWLLNGNSGTNPATHFLGTTDDQPLLFKVNNVRHGYLGNSIFFGNNAGVGNNIPGNIGIGERTLEKNSFGASNIAIGSYALWNNTEGYYNMALGYLSLGANTKGNNNTAVGNWALNSNATGSDNTAVGLSALHSNQTGYENTAIGSYALLSNKNPFNTATGFQALMANTFGFENAAFGHKSLKSNIDGAYNTAVGSSSLLSNTSGRGNTAIGTYALKDNTSGYDNTAIGYSTLSINNGYYNSALGTAAMVFNTTGHDNTAMGFAALNRNSTASFNTSIGAFSLYNNTIGVQNTAVGYKALQTNTSAFSNSAFGYQALFNNTGGLASANTAVGTFALWSNSSGAANTGIGYFAGASLPNNVSNVTAIGYSTGWNTTLSNHVNIGNFSQTWIGGQTGWFHYSDKRIKNDIKDDVPGLSFIAKLKPVTYHVDVRKQEEIANGGKQTNQELIRPVQIGIGENKPDEQLIRPSQKDWEGKYDVEKIKMTGFFAQDVEEAAKAINYSFNGVHNPKNGGLLSLDYSSFVVPLVKAVQEQQKIIDDQNKKIDKQQQQIELLIKEMQSLKKDLITQRN